MITKKILTNYGLLKHFYRFERNVISLVPVLKLHNLSAYPFRHHKPTFNVTRNISTVNEKLDDFNRGHNEVAQSFINFKYLRLIKNAVRESGPVVEDNKKLSEIIQNAQKNNISSEFINFAINIICNPRANIGLCDMLLGNGCHFVIQYEDIDQTLTRSHLLNLCDKYEGNLIQNDSKWSQNFDQKGIISITCPDSDSFTDATEKELLSKLEAETLHRDIDAEGLKYWKIYCDPWQLHDVKMKLNEITPNIEEAFIGYIPRNKVTPSHIAKNAVYNILIELRKIPTIDNVFHNVSYSI